MIRSHDQRICRLIMIGNIWSTKVLTVSHTRCNRLLGFLNIPYFKRTIPTGTETCLTWHESGEEIYLLTHLMIQLRWENEWTDWILDAWADILKDGLRSSKSHSLTVPSSDPEIRLFVWDKNSTQLTPSSWPRSTATGRGKVLAISAEQNWFTTAKVLKITLWHVSYDDKLATYQFAITFNY